MRSPVLIWWIVGAVIGLEILSFMLDAELRLQDLERLAVRAVPDTDEAEHGRE